MQTFQRFQWQLFRSLHLRCKGSLFASVLPTHWVDLHFSPTSCSPRKSFQNSHVVDITALPVNTVHNVHEKMVSVMPFNSCHYSKVTRLYVAGCGMRQESSSDVLERWKISLVPYTVQLSSRFRLSAMFRFDLSINSFHPVENSSLVTHAFPLTW